MTIASAIESITAYPIPQALLTAIALRRGFDPTAEATAEDFTGRSMRLASADLYVWLAEAPNVSQGGQSYSFSDEQRADLRRRARAIYSELAPEEEAAVGVVYGYKGSRL